MSSRNADGTAATSLKRKADDLSSDDSNDSNRMDCIEEETESESEDCDDCDNCDQACKVINTFGKSTLYGFYLKPDSLENTNLKKCIPKMSQSLKSNEFKNGFVQNWLQNTPFDHVNIQIITEPWKVCVVDGLLEDDRVLNEARREFYELDWNRRQMDLYDFYQSVDLKHIDTKCIKSIYDFLKNDVMPWVGEIMQVNLESISATCSFYTDTDYLLVHDDQQEDRVIAFVLYLSDVYPWDECWGGALQLLSSDKNGQPTEHQKDIIPKHNQLILFPVSNISYHQVAEVTTKNFCRLSINGWFHGKNIPKIIPKYVPPTTGLYSNNCSMASGTIDLHQWINNDYFRSDTILQIQEHIEEYSEISLESFFNEKQFSNILESCSKENNWKLVGPPNRIRYEVLEEKNMSKQTFEFIEFFKSKDMFILLGKYTDLELGCDGATMKFELQRWTPGCYSLLSDYEWNKDKELDVVVFLGCNNVVGGQIQYVSQDEEIHQALITLEPKDNTLNMVFRDTARITSHVSKHTKLPFYVLFCSYMEPKST